MSFLCHLKPSKYVTFMLSGKAFLRPFRGFLLLPGIEAVWHNNFLKSVLERVPVVAEDEDTERPLNVHTCHRAVLELSNLAWGPLIRHGVSSRPAPWPCPWVSWTGCSSWTPAPSILFLKIWPLMAGTLSIFSMTLLTILTAVVRAMRDSSRLVMAWGRRVRWHLMKERSQVLNALGLLLVKSVHHILHLLQVVCIEKSCLEPRHSVGPTPFAMLFAWLLYPKICSLTSKPSKYVKNTFCVYFPF